METGSKRFTSGSLEGNSEWCHPNLHSLIPGSGVTWRPEKQCHILDADESIYGLLKNIALAQQGSAN